jgi:hypothetical protein
MSAENYTVKVLRRSVVTVEEDTPGHAIKAMPETDSQGHVIFRDHYEDVESSAIEKGLEGVMAMAKSIIGKAAAVASGYRVEKITLKLAVTVEGVVLVGSGSVEGGIEVEIEHAGASPKSNASVGEGG